MRAINVDKLSLKDLMELDLKVQKAIGAAKERERADLKKKIEKMAAESGFAVNELFGGGRGHRRRGGDPERMVRTDDPELPSVRDRCPAARATDRGDPVRVHAPRADPGGRRNASSSYWSKYVARIWKSRWFPCRTASPG